MCEYSNVCFSESHFISGNIQRHRGRRRLRLMLLLLMIIGLYTFLKKSCARMKKMTFRNKKYALLSKVSLIIFEKDARLSERK